MKSTSKTSEQQGPKLQQVRICSNATAVDTNIKERSYLPSESPGRQRPPARGPHLHCQPLNGVGEGVDSGSTPSGHSGAWHAPELPWVGPAFLPGVQSPFQAVT